MSPATMPDAATIAAARDGDPNAIEAVVAGSLPLVYNIVGRALNGHADVDDVVQETMIRVVRGLPGLRDLTRFRSWLVAIAIRQARDLQRTWSKRSLVVDDEVVDPGSDFVDLTILRLALAGQRAEAAKATRWLDEDDRRVLSLWWLETSGDLSRAELADALGLSKQHAAVSVQRMLTRLDTARTLVRALQATPRCAGLDEMAARWDGQPSPLWRKRFTRHVRDCGHCGVGHHGLVEAGRLLAGLGMVPVPVAVMSAAALCRAAGVGVGFGMGTGGAGASGGAASGASAGGASTGGGHGWISWVRSYLSTRPAVAALAVGTTTTATVATVVLAVAALGSPGTPPAKAQPLPSATASASVEPSPVASSPSPSPSSVPASPSPSVRASSPAPAAAVPATRTAKKGVSAWYFDGVSDAMGDVKASWYYTWASSRGKVNAPGGVEFVPMIWGAKSVTSATLAEAKGQGSVILGFNEPDMAAQANMSVDQALDLWPQLQATGARLGSPSPAYGADTPGGWLDQFMSGARSRGYRVDFIALHWYGSDFSSAATGQLERYVKAVYERYHLPIWLTEYALIKFADGGSSFPTQEQQAAFVSASTAMLESLSYVERYAWFALPVAKTGDTGLYRGANDPTQVGAAYRAAGKAR